MSKFICIWSPQVKKLKLLLVWGRNKGIEKEVKHKYLAAFIMVHVSLVAQMVKKKKSACNAGDPGSIPGLGRSPGEGNGNPLQYSCLENPMDRGAWRATVHGVTKSWTQLSD